MSIVGLAVKAGKKAVLKKAAARAAKSGAEASAAPALKSAIRVGGKVYTGRTHQDALAAIPDPAKRREASLDANNRGFVNERGRFLDRFKAADYARNFGLFAEDAPSWARTAPELISENLAVKPLVEPAAKPVKATARRGRYQPVEPVESPHPELRDVEVPTGAGKVSRFAIENKIPIVGRRTFIAQSPGGYSSLAGGLPANRVTAEMRPFVDLPARQFIDPHELVKDFRSIIPLIGDKLRGGEEALSVAGREQSAPVRMYAGPDFPRQQRAGKGREVWASSPFVVSGLDSLARQAQERFGGRVAGMYTAMGPEALDQTTAMAELIGRQIEAGDISPSALAAFDQAFRTTTRKDAAPMADFVGFAVNPREAVRQLNDIKRTTMAQRRTMTQLMNAKPWLEAGFPDIGANRAALTTPELLYAPEGTSGYMISALEPGSVIPHTSTDVMLKHPNYPSKMSGSYVGGFEVGVPRELVWSDLFSRPEMKRYELFRQLNYLFGRPPKEIRKELGYDPRIQPIDEAWADRIAEYINAVKKYGPEPYAAGGFAVKDRTSAFAAKAA